MRLWTSAAVCGCALLAACAFVAILHSDFLTAALVLAGLGAAGIGFVGSKRVAERSPIKCFETFASSSESIVLATDLEGQVVCFNRAAEDALGYQAHEVIGKVDGSALQTIPYLDTQQGERVYRRKDGSAFSALVTSGAIRDHKGEAVGFFEIGFDISGLKAQEEVLLEKQALVESIAITSPTIFYIFDLAEQRIVYTNRRLGSLLGYSDAEIADMGGDPLPGLMHPEDLDILFNRYENCKHLRDGEVLEIEFRCLTSDGEMRWLQARDVVFKRDAKDWPSQILVSVVDATERKLLDEQIESQVLEIQDTNLALEIQTNALEEANSQLEALAFTDGLTGIANHRSFQEELARAFEVCKRRKQRLSLMLIDVDRFKQYNDEYGHPSGDIVLKRVAAVIRDACPSECTPARYGGEEYAVVCPGFSPGDVLALAERIREAIENTPWPERSVTVSIGAVSMAGEINSPSELVTASDSALYSSKASGRNCVTFYDFNDRRRFIA